MSTTKTRKTKTPNPDTAKPDSPVPAGQEPEGSGKPVKVGKIENSRPGVRIVSVGFPSKIARQLKLLSSVSGESIASIVVGAVSRVVAKRLPDVLAEIAKIEENGDGE
jgi:hypothetical protein